MTAGVCAAQADRPPLQRRTLSRLVHRLQMGVHVGCRKGTGHGPQVTGHRAWAHALSHCSWSRDYRKH